jgi:hypothetical protein
MRGGGRGGWTPYTPPCENLATTSSQPNFEALAMCVVLAHPCAAFHRCTCGLRRCAVVVAAALISYDHIKVAAEMTTRRRQSWLTTSSTSMHDYVGSLIPYIGSLLQLIFHCATHLVVTMIYDPFTCKFPECNGRCRASVAYPFPSSGVRAVLCSFLVWIFCCMALIGSIGIEKRWKLIVSCDWMASSRKHHRD